MSEEIYKNNRNNQIFFPSDFDPNDYTTNYRVPNYEYSLVSPDIQLKKGQKNSMYKYNNPKSPSYTNPKTPNYNNPRTNIYYNPKSPNYYNSQKYNNNTYNIGNNNTTLKTLTSNVPTSFSQKNNNNIIVDNKVMKIQERFDNFKNKINYLSNLINNNGGNTNIIQNNNINKNDIMIKNNVQYQQKFNNNTYYSIFETNRINKNNNLNNPKLKDLNEIHNHMQSTNPRDSLIKKMTGYRTTHINENNKTNNLVVQNIRKANNNNVYKNRVNNNNNRQNKINYNNKKNITNAGGDIQFNSFINSNNNFDNEFNPTNLDQFDLNNFPHEMDKIKDLDDMDINNKTFNFGDNNKFKNEFLLGDINNNNNNYNNNFIAKNVGNLKKNIIQSNKNIKTNIKNNAINKNNVNNNRIPENIKNLKNHYYNKYNDKIIDDINTNIEVNTKKTNDINGDDSSENLSDIAEEIVDTFQANSNNEINYLTPSPKMENQLDYNRKNNTNYVQLKNRENSNNFKFNNININQAGNDINDLDFDKIKSLKIDESNNFDLLDEKKIGIETSLFPNNNNLLYPGKNINNKKEKNIETIEINGINLNNISNDVEKNKYIDNSKENKNINKTMNNKKENNFEIKEPININNKATNNIVNNNINNNINSNFSDKKNPNDKIKQENLMDKKDFIQNINNLNIMKSLIIINNNETNTNNDNKIQSLKDIQNNDLNLDNFNNNNIINEPLSTNISNQITNSNIVLNISYSKDSQTKSIENKKNDLTENIVQKNLGIPEKKLEELNKPAKEQKSIIKKIYEETQNKEKEALKKNGRIQINLDNNIYYHYKLDSSLTDYCEIYNKNDDLIRLIKENEIMDLEQYMKVLKEKKNLKPAIKKYNKNNIKVNKDYKNAENLSERDIIPDLYEEEEDDIRSLEKSLERSIDKSFDKSYDKWYGQSFNEKINEASDMSCSGMNESYANNTGRNIINKLQEMFIEEIDEEQNEDEKEEDLNYNENK